MPTISEAEAASVYGMATSHEQMPNRERRFRLMDREGIGYVRTEAGEQGAWQNSHAHYRISETYIVQKGWIAVALLNGSGALTLRILRAGDVWTSEIGEVHNIYMPANAITHVVKHGAGGTHDWVTNELSEILDRETRALPETEILERATANTSPGLGVS